MFWDGYRWIDDRSFAQSHSHKSYSRPRWPAVLIATALTIAPVIPIVVGGRSDTSLTVGNTNGAGMILAGYAYGANKQKNGPADGSQRGGSALVSYPTPLPLTTSAPASTPPTPTPTRAPTAAPAVAPVPATPRPTPTATAAPTLSGQKVVQFGPSGTQAQFVSLMKDMTVDVIELEAGTYKGWHLGASGGVVISRAARPLLVRPAPGAAVVWDDTGGTSGDAWFYVGSWNVASHVTDYITFDPAGTGGSFTIQNYALGQQGLVSTFWVDHVAFNGFHTRGITGLAGGSTSWTVYVSSDGLHRSSSIVVNDWDVGPSAGKNVSGLQTYHDPQIQGVSAARWKIDGSHIAVLSWGDASRVDIEGWTITNCDYAVSTDGVAAGILKNNTATGSTNAPIIKAPFVDGGGNSWH